MTDLNVTNVTANFGDEFSGRVTAVSENLRSSGDNTYRLITLEDVEVKSQKLSKGFKLYAEMSDAPTGSSLEVGGMVYGVLFKSPFSPAKNGYVQIKCTVYDEPNMKAAALDVQRTEAPSADEPAELAA